MKNKTYQISFITKLISVLVSIALITSMCPGALYVSEASATESSSSENSEIGEIQEGVVYPGRPKSQDEIDEQERNGGVVEYFDAGDINYKNSIASSKRQNQYDSDKSVTLPAKVDMRNTSKVTSVKSQGQTGSCWAWAANATAETSIANSSGKTAVDLSAYQTAYFGYTALSTTESELKGTEVSQKGEGLSKGIHETGNVKFWRIKRSGSCTHDARDWRCDSNLDPFPCAGDRRREVPRLLCSFFRTKKRECCKVISVE